MDLPRPALVKQLDLRISSEGKGFIYLLLDRASGRILRLSREAALAFSRFQKAALGDRAARAALSEDHAKLGYSVLSMTRQMRDAERFAPKPFNPLSIQIPLFDLARFQPGAAWLSRQVFGLPGAIVLIAMALFAASLGVRNNGAVAAEFSTALSFESLLAFGAIAPFLKIFHEYGHFLAATRYQVKLRKAGINFIGFYPLPFVDCSDADLSATRRQRMVISSAGIFADVFVGLIAFILWHFVADAWVKSLLGRTFVYLALNSALLNGNPLMRLDGYYILSDFLHRRNLSTDASAALKRVWAGLLGRPTRGDVHWRLALFGAASLVYRFMVLFRIVWSVMPRFLGFGLLVGAWGGWLMIAAPLLKGNGVPPKAQPTGAQNTRSRWRGPVLGLAALGLLFVPVAPKVRVDLTLDLVNHYAVTTTRPGIVVDVAAQDQSVAQGAVLLRLANPYFDDAVVLSQQALAEADLALQVSRGIGAAETQAGQERQDSARAILELSEQELSELTIHADYAGRFTRVDQMVVGSYLPAGRTIGQLVPEEGPLMLAGRYPETRVDLFEQGVQQASWYDGTRYHDLSVANLTLTETMRTDQTSLARSFILRVELNEDQARLNSAATQVRLAFEPIPVWKHVILWFRTKAAQFRDAELAELHKRVE